MLTILESYRVEKGLTYEEMAKAAGYSNRSVVQRHAKGKMPISGEAALRYHMAFGLPLSGLRPDICETHRVVPAQPDEAAQTQGAA
jgi:transcriptional regulator with XRE-family HTH domain